ncbi:MAG: DUF4390 domain-containing protein [Gammaproteobacteria bacterium]|nr:DUF4390 domain-containing protein [Gammaproteobacteria bacterium]
MPNCKKLDARRLSENRKPHRTFIVLSILVSLFLLPGLLYAELNDGFIVENAELNPGETEYSLNADIQFHFSKEALKALEHGIALQIDIEIQAKMARKWLWDKTIRRAALSQKLEHQPLSDQYLVTDLNTGIKRHFQSLQHALEFMGTINNHPFFELTALKQGKTYTAQVRARLNTESLPTPLRLSAYIVADWQLSSPWFKWTIQERNDLE